MAVFAAAVRPAWLDHGCSWTEWPHLCILQQDLISTANKDLTRSYEDKSSTNHDLKDRLQSILHGQQLYEDPA